jgi:alpha-L-fucosidase
MEHTCLTNIHEKRIADQARNDRSFQKIVSFLLVAIMVLQVTMPLRAQEMDKMWGGQNEKNKGTKRGQFFDSGNYAMFVHWGLYSQLANRWEGTTYYGIGEWLMNRNMAGIPVAEYKATAKTFNPTLFDAKALAQLA